jgi:hypothetical protein
VTASVLPHPVIKSPPTIWKVVVAEILGVTGFVCVRYIEEGLGAIHAQPTLAPAVTRSVTCWPLHMAVAVGVIHNTGRGFKLTVIDWDADAQPPTLTVYWAASFP